MTLEQRQQAFIAAYKALEARYGLTLLPRTVPADTPVAVTPPLVVVPVDGWLDPEAGTSVLDSATNGKEHEAV